MDNDRFNLRIHLLNSQHLLLVLYLVSRAVLVYGETWRELALRM